MPRWIRAPRRWAAASLFFLLTACAATGHQAAAAKPLQLHSALGSYLAGHQAAINHDYDDAARFFSRALASNKNNDELIRSTLLMRVSAGQVADAVPLAQHLLTLDGDSGVAGLVLLVQDIKSGQYQAAVQVAKAMPQDGTQRIAVPLLEAWAEAGLGQPAAALRALDAMGGPDGLKPLHDLHVALIEDYCNRIDAAMAAYRKLVSGAEPSSWRVTQLAGNFFERHGRAAEARRLYEASATHEGLSEVAAIGIARIAHGVVPPRLIASPADGAAEALFDLAGLLNQSETANAALVYARLALHLSPHFALAKLLVGEIRDDEGYPEEALALYQSVDPKSPFSWMARLKAALELDALGRTDEAVTELKAMAAEKPSQREPLIELGDILREHKRFSEAVTAYDGAIARTPHPQASDWRLFYSRGVALDRSGQWARAEADMEHALALQPDQPVVLNYLGYSWIDRGEHLHEALKMVQRAVELRPDDGYIIDSLGWAYFRLGNLPEATRFLVRAIELLPDDPTINDHLGDVYWRTGRLVEARYQWRRALLFKPDAEETKGIEAKLEHGLGAPPDRMRGG